MKPVNIFRVSRIRDEELFNIAEKHEASDHDNHRVPVHEINSLRILVDALTEEGIRVTDADGFYFGFVIPQIGKEFDLIKVTGKYCLNIELKSQDVTEEQIAAQLRKNRHYLTLLGRELMLFTVVTDTLTCYRLSEDDELINTDSGEIAAAVKKCNAAYHGRIEKLFRASEYLIAPDKQPDKFLQGQYFLTPAQDYVKTSILRAIENSFFCSFFHITGRPCTGKTLLLYDIAKHLSGTGRTLIICGREPTEGLLTISDSIENLDFIAASELQSDEQIRGYEYILVDESRRMQVSAFEMICRTAEKNDQICIFSTDPDAILTDIQQEYDIAGRIRGLGLSGEYELSEKLRMNMELYTFIMRLRHLKCKTEKSYEFEHVSVNYANDVKEARALIRYFRDKGYVFINAHRTEKDPFKDLDEDFGTQQVIGREYDKAVLLMDNSFYYDEEGFLKGIPQPDPEFIYPNIFYHGISRVRERLAIVILDAPELLRNVLSIL